jgi:hypothetical protein
MLQGWLSQEGWHGSGKENVTDQKYKPNYKWKNLKRNNLGDLKADQIKSGCQKMGFYKMRLTSVVWLSAAREWLHPVQLHS